MNKYKNESVFKINGSYSLSYHCHFIQGTCSFSEYTCLEKIICDENEITALVDIPVTVTYINCKSNLITELDNLPENLTKLICDSNRILSLNNLPNGLKFLSCDCNLINQLDNLPQGLVYLSCCSNPIVYLNCLPETLEVLYLYDMNKLVELNDLPNSINELLCDVNIETVSMKNFSNV